MTRKITDILFMILETQGLNPTSYYSYNTIQGKSIHITLLEDAYIKYNIGLDKYTIITAYGSYTYDNLKAFVFYLNTLIKEDTL